MSQQTPAKQLFDLLLTKNFEPQLLNTAGKPESDPAETEVFSFDYVGQSGKDYGTVAILLSSDKEMNVYFGDNLGKSMEPDDKNDWFSFLQQLRLLARKNLMTYNLADLNKLKYSMQGQAAIKEGLFESWTGNKTTSWTNNPSSVKLVIKHNKTISESDKRFRYIQALFLETDEGERFKLPFTKLAGGRAMLEHVKQGGRPYDLRGQHITEMVNNINILSRFRKANQNKIFEGDAATLVETATQYYTQLQKNIKTLANDRGYTQYFESWQADKINHEDIVIEDLKSMFVTQNLDTRVEQALPLLAQLQKENQMKEANIFEGWINCLAEGTWALPDTPEKQQQLIDLLAKELPVGPDASNATEVLYDILGNDDLFDQLQDLAREDADADARVIIVNFLEDMKNDPAVAQVIGKLKISREETKEETETAAMNNSSTQIHAPLDEGQMKELMWRDAERMSLEQFVEKYGDEDWVREFWNNIMGDLDESRINEGSMKDMLWDLAERMERDQFIEYTTTEMGQDEKEMSEFWDNIMGDLDEPQKDDQEDWNDEENLEIDLNKHGIDPEGDYEEETNETDGGANWLAETNTALQGPYGHSGRLKAVNGTNADMMDRIKFLAGINK